MTMYNLYLDTVAEVAPMPEPRYRFGYGVVGDKLYVFGGFSAIEDFAETAPLPSRTMIFSFTTVCACVCALNVDSALLCRILRAVPPLSI